MLWMVLYGAFWTAGFWAYLLGQVFGLAGTMLGISTRARRTFTAGVLSYALLLVYVIPPVAVLVFLLLGPITINRLVNDFDKLAVPD